MAARRGARRGETGAFALLAVGAIVMVNVAAARLRGRCDLTEDRLYTLSAPSRALVQALPDPLTVKAYLPGDLPPELALRARHLRDLLEEYRVASDGKLRVELVDRADARAEEEATRCGLAPTAFELRRGRNLEVGRAIVGLCLWYGGRSRSLAAPASPAEAEYRISAALKRVAGKPRKVAFSTGHGERDLGDGYSFVRLGLAEEHDVVTLDPSAGLADDVDVLVVAGPRRPFDDRGRAALEAFLGRGKGVLFLVDGMTPRPADAGRGEAAGVAVDTGLGPVLEGQGFRVRGDLVFDAQNAPGPVPGAAGGLYANRPAFVEATRPALGPGPTPPLVAGIPALVLPYPSAVELVGPVAAGPPAGATLSALARTTPSAWRLPDRGQGPFTLAYAYAGPRRGAAPPVRLVVVGGSSFAADDVMRLLGSFPVYAGGPELVFRAVDWLLEDEALAPLRANVQRARPLRAGVEAHAAALTWGNAVGVPLAFCAAGVLRWRRRRGGGRRRYESGEGR